MQKFLDKASSRKFLIAVSATAAFLATGNAPAALATVLAYLGVQGYADSKGAV